MPTPRPPQSQTVATGDPQSAHDEDRESRPKLPHERDESAGGASAAGPRKVIRQAHDDLERGLTDTDKGPVLDKAYRKLKK